MTAQIDAVHFVDAQKGWAVVSSTILRTTIGGATWTRQPNDAIWALHDIDFSDAMHGWIVGQNGTILRTVDGGETWTLFPSATTSTLFGVDFVDAENGWVAGTGGAILRVHAPVPPPVRPAAFLPYLRGGTRE